MSIVIPTFNHRDFILATLESVFAQTYTDYEVIVVNDGSPDDTAALLRPLAEAGRIIYLEQPNQGQAAARTRGLETARGEYIAFLDDDDLWPPDKIEWQVRVLAAEPDTVVVYGPHAFLQPDGSTRPLAPTVHPTGWVYEAFLNKYCMISPGQALIRASALRRVGRFDPELWGVDDWDLYLRLAKVGEFRFVERTALLYRLHASNASRSALRHFRSEWRAIRKHAGWNVPLIISILRSGRGYFGPNLMQFAEDAYHRGDHWDGIKASLMASALWPGMWIKPGFLVLLAKHTARLIRRR